MQTFNKITKGLRKTITKLEQLVESNGDKSIVLSEQIAECNETISALNAEGARADITASKLRDLIGD